MQIINTILYFIGVLGVMSGVIYLFKLFKEKKPADIIPFNNVEREAVKKAQLELEAGIKEARARYQARKEAYLNKSRQLSVVTNNVEQEKPK